MTVHFKITISGSGNTVDDCWNDAVESLSLDSGVTPEEDEYEIVEDEDDEEENEDE